MPLNVLIPWTLATKTTEETAGGAAGLYTLPQTCNEVRVTYVGAAPDIGALLILPQIVNEALVAATISKSAFAAAKGESIEVADGAKIDRVSVYLDTNGTVAKTIVMGRFKLRRA